MIYTIKNLNIDKKLLEKQVKQLLKIRFGNYVMPQPQKDALDGTINLIEEIQDQIEKEKND